jgi:uncharacterized membrane protein
VTDTTTVGQVVGVSLEPNRSADADPGTVLAYSHTLINTGNETDTFDLSHVSSQGWTVTYDTPVVLDSGEEATVVVNITVPADALGDSVDSTTVTATSRTIPTVSDTATDTTTVNRVAGVSLAPDRSGAGEPGTVVTYSHSLINTGNYVDIIDLSHVSSQGWTVTYAPSVTLDPGEETTIMVSVTVPIGVPDGTVDSTVITARSQTVPSAFAEVTATTTAEVVWRLFLPLIYRH